MSNFRTIDRQTGFLLPPSVDEWLPERHLARFVVEVIDGLDVHAMIGAYRGAGSAAHHPRMLLGVLVYGYATGVFSSRKLERATYDSVAFRFIAANDHPDHDTIAAFRRRFLKEIEALFVQVLLVAREMGVLQMGTIGLDGTKIHANASRHSALSHEHAGKIEAQLQAEVADLMAKAEAADAADLPDGLSIPDELARREERLRKIAAARAKIEARAKDRHARDEAEHEAKLAARAAKTAATGKKACGKPPEPPGVGPAPGDQINLTDEDSRIMPVAGGGFDQCYNAQAARCRWQSAGHRGRCGSGRQRQAAARTDAGKDRRVARGSGRARNHVGGRRLFQRRECRRLRGRGDRAADRDGPSAASSAFDRTLRDSAVRAGKSDAG
jgi:transposase